MDWDYYVERLGNCIQKIITIPAALQGVPNPVPRIAHPDWLQNKIKNRFLYISVFATRNFRNDSIYQRKITDMFSKVAKPLAGVETNQNGKRPASADEIEQDSKKVKNNEKVIFGNRVNNIDLEYL